MPLAAATTTEIIALASGAIAVLALAGALALWMVLRSVRASQRAVLGPAGTTDVVSYVVHLEREVAVLRDYLEDVAGRLDGRVKRTEARLDHALSRRALVRYDAYGEMSGHQSLSLALLDASESGVILTSILHRDAARIYLKEVRGGRSELTLSPEEEEALRAALGQGA
ncbi:MAG TPA: DUF4446 family protein [Solirubrobacteraceae bacterium]